MRAHAIVVAAALLVLPQSRTPAQVLSGRVLETDSSRPIASATVSALARGQALLTVSSDSAGRFRLQLPRPGWYSVRVDRLGYTTATTDSVFIGGGEMVEISIRLGVSAVPLAAIMVIERRTSLGAHAGFYRRLEFGQKTGNGWFFTKAALDTMKVSSVTSALARVPMVSLNNSRRPVILSRGGCLPTIYLNGALLQFAPGETIDDMIDRGELEGIEIYRNRTELPYEFAGPGECGAIVFWTRAEDPGRRGMWRFFAGGALVLGMVARLVAQ